MPDNELGWRGKRVRHADGRAGVIQSEYVGFGFVGLRIFCDDESEGYVQLNSSGRDGGDAGWEWWCPEFSAGPRYLPLGDHNR